MTQYAQSVTGALSKDELGKVLMHEHILCDLRDPSIRADGKNYPTITMDNRFQTDYFQNRNPDNMVLDDVCGAGVELQRFGDAGGTTIVELTVGGLRPRPLDLRGLSLETGINIIMGAGFYVDSYRSESTRQLDIDGLEQLLVEQLDRGVWGSDIRAGIIGEIGCSWPLQES